MIVRMFEYPDGSVCITAPNPENRYLIPHPFERTIRVPSTLTVEQHNAAIAAEVVAICKEHPEFDGCPSSLEVSADAVPVPKIVLKRGEGGEPPEVFLDVTIRLTFGVPETDEAMLERQFGQAVEKNSDLDGLPYRDIDPSSLPSQYGPCLDGCGEEHAYRGQWRMQGEGEDRWPVVDPKVRNITVEQRHVTLAEEHALQEDDDLALVRAMAVREMFKRHVVDGGPVPPSEVVAKVTKAVLAARTGR